MIVDKNIELEIKFLKEYPDWNFLSQDELNRMTIEIFLDMKTAKKDFCKKDQKVIKVQTPMFLKSCPYFTFKGNFKNSQR